MKKVFAVMLLCLICAGSAAAQDNTSEQYVGVFVPEGDPKAGRQAFIDLKCFTCHAVDGDAVMPKSVSANRGPTFGVVPKYQSVGELADAIISPSHSIAEGTYPGTLGTASPMGDFTRTMTVRQLIDLLAYLKSLQQ